MCLQLSLTQGPILHNPPFPSAPEASASASMAGSMLTAKCFQVAAAPDVVSKLTRRNHVGQLQINSSVERFVLPCSDTRITTVCSSISCQRQLREGFWVLVRPHNLQSLSSADGGMWWRIADPSETGQEEPGTHEESRLIGQNETVTM